MMLRSAAFWVQRKGKERKGKPINSTKKESKEKKNALFFGVAGKNKLRRRQGNPQLRSAPFFFEIKFGSMILICTFESRKYEIKTS